MFDVVIVGGGPIGCKTGELIAKEGFKVLILEERSRIGEPVRCSGLVSHRIFKLSEASKEIVINVVKRASLHSLNNSIELRSKKPVYVIDRKEFDKELAEMAMSEGVKIETSNAFKNYKRGKKLSIKTNKGKLQTNLLVGADGPTSTVARVAGIDFPEDVLVGIQSTIKSSFDSESVELWFDPDVSPEFFGWVIPEDKSWGRVGLATKEDGTRRFGKFVKKRFGGKLKFKDELAGVIRFGLIDDSTSDRVLLVGGAASQVKPFSGGGLIYGLIGAGFAAKVCVKSLEEERLDHEFLNENYDLEWKRELEWPIRKGSFLSGLVHSVPSWLLDLSIGIGKAFRTMLERTDVDLLDSDQFPAED